LRSCGSIKHEKFSTGRVPAARLPWQPGILADDNWYVNTKWLTEEDRILIKNLYLLKGYCKTNKVNVQDFLCIKLSRWHHNSSFEMQNLKKIVWEGLRGSASSPDPNPKIYFQLLLLLNVLDYSSTSTWSEHIFIFVYIFDFSYFVYSIQTS